MSRSIARRALVASGLSAPLLIGRRSAASEAMAVGDIYGAVTAEGPQLSEAARRRVGHPVTMRGYMAPPLKAESDFFVLTRYPMSICPFCSNAADWPMDIVVIHLSRVADMLDAAYAIEVSGVLDVGVKVDASSGFVSLVRLVDATWRRV